MALPICIEIPEIPDPFDITLPGGVQIEHIKLAEIIQPALTPIVPMLDIVDTLVAMFNCIKAIPDSLGPPPDPTVISTCLPDLAEKVAKLMRLLPQLWLPYLIVRLIDLLIDALRQARDKIADLQQQMASTLGAIDRARDLDDAGLMAIAQCAQANVAQEAANVGKNLASLGKLIGIINGFMRLVGGPEVPGFAALAGRPLDDALPPLDEMIERLQQIRALVPLP